ncbi:hypothetical protein [Corynebacterium xerosis]|nr:hypothetical protein [Corynebacterium xerosis]
MGLIVLDRVTMLDISGPAEVLNQADVINGMCGAGGGTGVAGDGVGGTGYEPPYISPPAATSARRRG